MDGDDLRKEVREIPFLRDLIHLPPLKMAIVQDVWKDGEGEGEMKMMT